MAGHLMTNAERIALQGAARELHDRFRGVFGEETITQLLLSSYQDLAATATVPDWLALGAERFARQRLEALAHPGGLPAGGVPAVLFLCAHNAGRRQMALAWFSHLAGKRAVAWSAGTGPTVSVDPAVRAAMAEVGASIGGQLPEPWAADLELAADAVVTMGPGDACPLLPGKHYEDWHVDDPSGLSLDQVRPIRDDIRRKVTALLHRLGITTTH